MKRHVKEDFQLILIRIVAVIAPLFLLPFALFRFIEGNYLVAIADVFMSAVVISMAWLAWKSGKTRLPGQVISVLLSIGTIVVVYKVGLSGVFWVYPLLILTFFLCPAGMAITTILFVSSAIAVFNYWRPAPVFGSTGQLVSFLATVVSASLFNFVFALEDKLHRRFLARMASKDALTELANRRSMEQQLQRAVSEKEFYGHEFGLVVLDIDQFKSINDQAGHIEGDKVLKAAGALIAACIRSSDMAFRYGGDEFVVLLANINRSGLESVCRNLVERFAASIRVDALNAAVTISVGAALLADSTHPEAWFARADRCLYQAKQQGRNCFVID